MKGLDMIEITQEDAIAGLTSLVEERGFDYVYEAWEENQHYGKRCTYVKDGVGDCGVGAYLINKGVPVERLEEIDNGVYAQGAEAVLDVLKREGVLTFTAEGAKVLARFQGEQDGGLSWGYSLHVAKNGYSRSGG